MDHQDHDRLSLAMHQYLCEKLRRNPDLFIKIKKHLVYVESIMAGPPSKYHIAWKEAIYNGLDALIGFVLQKTQWGQVIRSCSLFSPLWETPEERLDFIDKWRCENVIINRKRPYKTEINYKFW